MFVENFINFYKILSFIFKKNIQNIEIFFSFFFIGILQKGILQKSKERK